MVILSVDYGDVRTGVAVCDKSELLASPVAVITERRAERLAEKIAALAAQYRAERIALGLPKNMDGTEGFRAQACREFAALLERETGLPVVLRDERLTTVSAHNYLNATDTRGKKRKETVDAVSAVIILEDYLAYRKNAGRGSDA
ncbi:MAG: Holliday junction resolvase RuvX [Clostridia bacterium]|nr:Holliday junction resolvase RuvX [Clostridia bacterium]